MSNLGKTHPQIYFRILCVIFLKNKISCYIIIYADQKEQGRCRLSAHVTQSAN